MAPGLMARQQLTGAVPALVDQVSIQWLDVHGVALLNLSGGLASSLDVLARRPRT
jgi:hypothetical protein